MDWVKRDTETDNNKDGEPAIIVADENLTLISDDEQQTAVEILELPDDVPDEMMHSLSSPEEGLKNCQPYPKAGNDVQDQVHIEEKESPPVLHFPEFIPITSIRSSSMFKEAISGNIMITGRDNPEAVVKNKDVEQEEVSQPAENEVSQSRSTKDVKRLQDDYQQKIDKPVPIN